MKELEHYLLLACVALRTTDGNDGDTEQDRDRQGLVRAQMCRNNLFVVKYEENRSRGLRAEAWPQSFSYQIRDERTRTYERTGEVTRGSSLA